MKQRQNKDLMRLTLIEVLEDKFRAVSNTIETDTTRFYYLNKVCDIIETMRHIDCNYSLRDIDCRLYNSLVYEIFENNQSNNI